MANAREIKNRISSVKDTAKITKAMYLISSTKLRKAKKSLEDTEPYFYNLQMAIARLLRHMPDMRHSFLRNLNDIDPEKRRRGLIVVTADKGLAGAYNHNVIKCTEAWLKEPGVNSLFVVGELGRSYFMNKGMEIDAHFRYTTQNPSLHRARKIIGAVVDKYQAGELDEITIVYTRMVNSMVTQAEVVPLLPLDKKKIMGNIPAGFITEQDITMLPSPKEVLDTVIPNYLVGFVYGALVESFCSEQNARMMAMQAANDNADDIIKDLAIQYNRVRQAAITQEITEVVAGAKAQHLRK